MRTPHNNNSMSMSMLSESFSCLHLGRAAVLVLALLMFATVASVPAFAQFDVESSRSELAAQVNVRYTRAVWSLIMPSAGVVTATVVVVVVVF